MGILAALALFVAGAAAASAFFAAKYVSLSKENAAKEQKIKDLGELLQQQSEMRNMLKGEFENIALKVLDDKNSKISEMNRLAVENVVVPFKEKIDEFKSKIENMHIYEVQQRAVMDSELKRLMELNKQISKEANNLAGALKGESKFQGIWGELGIEKILESSGMVKGIHYFAQQSCETQEGRKMPDFIVNLPENKHIVIDSKTSLTAYERYFNCEDEFGKQEFLKEHAASVKKHVDELSKKNYQDLPALSQPDYVLMFIPLDAASALALKSFPGLLEYAFSKNVVIVTPSTLLAAMKTVGYMWRQENQKKNVLEIAKQGGMLYDKFVSFTQALIEADKKIDEAKIKTQEAVKRLSFADKKGDSLIERAQKLKELGAAVKKEMPKELSGGIENDSL
ncbi:MAG: DNA recombination protein RmuC [Endomicrobium sp.]|jgi:DNA recombination protein RmuC|nr:DNA recombination protein RmuC [Endomicrobium sp.]